MTYRLDEESKNRIEDLADLQEHVSAIHAEVGTGEDGQEEIQVSIILLPSFSTSTPSAETGEVLNEIASSVRQRAKELPVSTVISFSKEGEE
jgi:protoheme ferro-lyase